MKAGDKLYCIKSIRDRNGNILYTKGRKYTIKKYYDELNPQIYIEDNFGKTGPAFYLSYSHKYFITMQENRKLKLEKLRNV